jgi:hypothetical protein
LSFTLAAFALALFAPENCGTVVTGIGGGLGVAFPFATFAINALGVRDVVKPPRLLRLERLDLDRLDLDRLVRLDLDRLDLDRLDLDRLIRLDLDRLERLERLLPPLWPDWVNTSLL